MAPESDDKTRVVAPPGNGKAEVESGGNALPIGTRIGEFELTGMVGEGGFGIVYLAYDHSLERSVALKEYMPSSLASRVPGSSEVRIKTQRNADTFKAGLRSFVNEAKVLAQFDHPALVKVYRFWEQHGTAYMVMPYYEGITLKEWLKRRDAPPDEATLKRLLGPVLEALDVIHRAQIYHRDIAPDNILLLEGERPLLLDFGAARRVIGDMTQALTVILKPGYAPIEQYAEVPGMKQGAFTDIYALGALIYYAIMGRTPPPSVARMVNDSMQPLAEAAAGRYSDAFLKAVDRCLAVRQEDRPQSIREMWGLLGIAQDQFTQVLPSAAVLDMDGARHLEQLDRATRPAWPWLAGMVGVAVAAGGAWYLFRGEPAPAPTPPAVIAESRPTEQEPAPPALPASPGTPGPEARTPPPETPAAVPPTPPGAPDKPAEGEKRPTEAAPAAPKPPEVAKPEVREPPPAAPRGIDPVVALQAVYQLRDRDRPVSVEVNRLRVQIGKDKPSFRVRSTLSGYLYVLMVGTEAEHLIVLFPNAIDRDNRIEAGRELTLPRTGWSFVAGGPPGLNHLVAIVSESPRDFSAAGLQAGDPFDEFPLRRLAELSKSSGGFDFLAGRADCATASCAQGFGAAVFSIEEIK